jgi:NAD(P)-dependent dehydrogenase (short-subunit alcohol dehydrogenase family)
LETVEFFPVKMNPVLKQGKTSRIKRMRRPKMEFSGKVALITGGGMGIGEAIARAFAREGADIIIGDINLELARKVVRDVERMGRKGLAIQTDVSVKVDVDRLVTDVDYKGTYLCSRRVGKEMVRQKSGSVVNISSVIGLASAPLVAYGPAKSAVIMLTKILATEWGKYNVRVNAIAPGYTLTPLLKGMIERGERDPQRILKRTPMGKMVEPEDIAQAALFLSSEKARYITGVTLPVDAGFLADGVWSAYGGYDR